MTEGAFTGKPADERSAEYDASRFYGSAMVSLPDDDPLLWDDDEQTTAEVCATLFVQEYLYDFSATRAMERLGVEHDRCVSLGKEYQRHWFVQRKVRQAVMRFREAGVATEGNVLSLIYRDACNFSPLANPVARVASQKTLAKLLCMEPEDRLRRDKHEAGEGDDTDGGVMLVDGMARLDEWEERTAEAQAKLKEEVAE